MLLKLKQDIENLFEYVYKFKKENRSLYGNIKQDIEEKVKQIKQEFTNVDQKIIRNYASQITALKIIDSTMQDLKLSLEISTLSMSTNKKKNGFLIQQEGKNNIKVLQTKIQGKLKGIQELEDIEDIDIHQNNELLGINVFRLNQIYQNEVENLQYQFQLLKQYQNERFDKLNQSFDDIINEMKFKKIHNQIQVYQEICYMLDQYKEELIRIIENQEQDSYGIDRTKSLQSLHSVTDFLTEGHYEVKQGKGKPLQEEIKNKRKESSSETCINCVIF